MVINLSKYPITNAEAYKIHTSLGLDQMKFVANPSYVSYACFNHGTAIGLLSFIPRCDLYGKKTQLIGEIQLQERFSSKDLEQSFIRLLRTKYPKICDINIRSFATQKKNEKYPAPEPRGKAKETEVSISQSYIVSSISPCTRCGYRMNPGNNDAVVMIVENPEGYVLVQWRCDYAKWSLPTGTIEKNKDINPLTLVRKEAEEELGIAPTIANWSRVSVVTTKDNVMFYVYKTKLDHIWTLISNEEPYFHPVINLVHKRQLRFINPHSDVIDIVWKYV